MRIHEGSFAYDLEQKKDPLTQLVQGWKFTLFQMHPGEHILGRGEAKTRVEAEKQASAMIAKLNGKREKTAV